MRTAERLLDVWCRNASSGTQPPDKGAAGRYIRARLLPQEHLARGGFRPAGTHANYKRDYLLPRLNQDGLLEKKPASYADAMVATAGLLSILGLPLEVQGYWSLWRFRPRIRTF